jgi:hypothetical protein
VIFARSSTGGVFLDFVDGLGNFVDSSVNKAQSTRRLMKGECLPCSKPWLLRSASKSHQIYAFLFVGIYYPPFLNLCFTRDLRI